jgi:glucokinase
MRAKEQGVCLENEISAKTVFEKARNGDAFFLSIVQESAEKFAKVLSVLIDIFNPEVIVAGGVFMRNYEVFMPMITPILQRECLPDNLSICKILPAKIGENIGDYAALAVAILEK